MAPPHEHHYNYALNHVLSPFTTQKNLIYQPPLPNSDHAFPILPIALLSVMGTAFLLAGFYVITNKCCSYFPQFNLLRWFTLCRSRRNDDNSFIALSPTMWNRGLDQSVIREIPTFQYRKGEYDHQTKRSSGNIYGCVVCLNEFQEQDLVRVLPNCSHAFHLDCIDVWFQGNANCPLCRTSISGTTKYPILDNIIAPTSSPQGSQVPYTDSLIGGDEDYVVIELGGDGEASLLPQRQQELDNPREVGMQCIRRQSSLKMEHKLVKFKRSKHQHGSSMGDECIDVRAKNDDQFSIQPLRRSLSLNSAVDQQLYLNVQEVIQQNPNCREISTNEEGSNRVRRSFFPFGHGRGSKNAVLPVEFEL